MASSPPAAPVKRGRGRPRKTPGGSSTSTSSSTAAAASAPGSHALAGVRPPTAPANVSGTRGAGSSASGDTAFTQQQRAHVLHTLGGDRYLAEARRFQQDMLVRGVNAVHPDAAMQGLTSSYAVFRRNYVTWAKRVNIEPLPLVASKVLAFLAYETVRESKRGRPKADMNKEPMPGTSGVPIAPPSKTTRPRQLLMSIYALEHWRNHIATQPDFFSEGVCPETFVSLRDNDTINDVLAYLISVLGEKAGSASGPGSVAPPGDQQKQTAQQQQQLQQQQQQQQQSKPHSKPSSSLPAHMSKPALNGQNAIEPQKPPLTINPASTTIYSAATSATSASVSVTATSPDESPRSMTAPRRGTNPTLHKLQHQIHRPHHPHVLSHLASADSITNTAPSSAGDTDADGNTHVDVGGGSHGAGAGGAGPSGSGSGSGGVVASTVSTNVSEDDDVTASESEEEDDVDV